MKKNIIMLSLVTIFSSLLWAKDFSRVNEMINLPHPVKVIMPNMEKLEISKKQKEKLNKEMLGYYPEIIQGLMNKVSKLENEIKNDILIDKKTKAQLSSKIDKLEKIKREITDIHIDALNTLADILSTKQFAKSLKMIQPKKKSNKFRIDELVLLPHPGKYIKMGQIKASQEQKILISKNVKKKLAPIFQDKIREAFKLEKKVQRMVSKGKPKENIKPLLDQIMKLKREAIDTRLDALYKIKSILTKEQWNKVNKLTYK